MRACYVQDEETGSVELVLLPADETYEVSYREKPYPDSLVQVKLSGDTYAGGYAGGRTMRQSASVLNLVFEGQDVMGRCRCCHRAGSQRVVFCA